VDEPTNVEVVDLVVNITAGAASQRIPVRITVGAVWALRWVEWRELSLPFLFTGNSPLQPFLF
jgi:hypothetical protein